ncbi:glycoside hydrolase family 75 protein [Streptomyces sp. NPDC000410]|uniref:glycoside hydrolase family 75 protein n=1 Tax=Streptomyces sp. NPDC000410 TaxID=3154254 RepID=UPI00331848F4
MSPRTRVSPRTKAIAVGGVVLLTAAALAAEAPPSAAARDASEGSVSASELLDELESCERISDGHYRTDADEPAEVAICEGDDVVFWTADLDIDCDGRSSEDCNEDTDPYYQSETAFQEPDGDQLDPATLPFIVVPGPSDIWTYSEYGISGGSVAAVIYKGRVRYAVVGDVGPSGLIGEASYALADQLGIDPDPEDGGTDSGVTYIVFRDTKVFPIQYHKKAVTVGNKRARKFVGR